MRLGIFKVRSLSTANGVMVLAMAGMFAMFFFATIYVQEVLGYSPIKSGFAFLPFTVGIIGGSVAAQQLIPRIGVKAQILSRPRAGRHRPAADDADHPEGDYVGELLPAVVVLSIGMGMLFVPLTLLATTNVNEHDAGLASGLFNTSQQVGGALGLAILSTFATSRTENQISDGVQASQALVDGYHLAFLIGAVFMAVGAIAVTLLIRRADTATINADEAAVAMAH